MLVFFPPRVGPRQTEKKKNRQTNRRSTNPKQQSTGHALPNEHQAKII